MAGQLRFFREGFSEIGRKWRRSRLRSQLAGLERQRQEALTNLGRRSWELAIDLTAFPELRNQLQLLQERAGQLASTTGKLQDQLLRLQSQRAAEVSRLDALCQPVRARKAELDLALRAARGKLGDSDRAIGALQNRLSRLAAELGRDERSPGSGGQAQADQLVSEQKALSEQLAAAGPVRDQLLGEVAALDAETRRCSDELSRIEAERKATLAPIDAEINRVQQESRGASQESSNVGQEQRARFAQLGAAVYEQKVTDPGLNEPVQAVQVIDEARARTATELASSLASTVSMPRWTMLKFWAVPVVLFVVAIVTALIALALLAPSTPSLFSGGGSTTSARSARTQAVSSEESRKDEVVQSFLGSPDDESKRQAAVEILEADLMAIGSSANRGYLPNLLKILQRGEPRLRAAAAQAMGMIEPSPSEVPVLVQAVNDPVLAVREGALTALGQVRDNASTRLLLRRIHADDRSRSRAGDSRFEVEREPDPAKLGMPVYAGARFLHFASDLEIGRAAFSSPDPLPKVLDYYTSKAGRPAMTGEEFTRTYLGGSPADPTGARRMMGEMETWFKEVTQSSKPQSEIRAEMDRRTAQVQNLPLVRYADTELYGTPSFVAMDETSAGGVKRATRFVVIFHDLSLGRTGFEVQAVP